jgi:hypothetical protein
MYGENVFVHISKYVIARNEAIVMTCLFKKNVILNAVKDLLFVMLLRPVKAANRSFTAFRMTNLSKRYFPFNVSRILIPAMTCKVLLVPVFFNNLYRILHIIKRNIGHNAVTQVEDEARLVFHPIKQAVYAVFNYFFIGV